VIQQRKIILNWEKEGRAAAFEEIKSIKRRRRSERLSSFVTKRRWNIWRVIAYCKQRPLADKHLEKWSLSLSLSRASLQTQQTHTLSLPPGHKASTKRVHAWRKTVPSWQPIIATTRNSSHYNTFGCNRKLFIGDFVDFNSGFNPVRTFYINPWRPKVLGGKFSLIKINARDFPIKIHHFKLWKHLNN